MVPLAATTTTTGGRRSDGPVDALRPTVPAPLPDDEDAAGPACASPAQRILAEGSATALSVFIVSARCPAAYCAKLGLRYQGGRVKAGALCDGLGVRSGDVEAGLGGQHAAFERGLDLRVALEEEVDDLLGRFVIEDDGAGVLGRAGDDLVELADGNAGPLRFIDLPVVGVAKTSGRSESHAHRLQM